MNIVPVCITSEGDLVYPKKVRNVDRDTFRCENTQKTFYAINPAVRPLPKGAEIFCFKPDEFIQQYDSFRIDNSCVSFIAWNNPVPESIPLYIYETGSSMLASLEKLSGMKENPVSPIYVLKSPVREDFTPPKSRIWILFVILVIFLILPKLIFLFKFNFLKK